MALRLTRTSLVGFVVTVAPQLRVCRLLAVEHVDHPWKIVQASLIAFQLRRRLGLRPAGVGAASRIGVPVNLFDAMRVVLRKGS